VERYQNCLDFSYEEKFENYFEKSFEFSARKQLFCLMVHLSLLVRMGIYLSRQLLISVKRNVNCGRESKGLHSKQKTVTSSNDHTLFTRVAKQLMATHRIMVAGLTDCLLLKFVFNDIDKYEGALSTEESGETVR